MLTGIDKQSLRWKRPVTEIKHDRQSQFQGALKTWHEIYSKAAREIIDLPGNEQLRIGRVTGSKFVVSSAPDSPGLQIIDLALWIIKNHVIKNRAKHKPPSWDYDRLVKYVLNRTAYFELSLDSIENYLHEFFTMLDAAPLSDEQLARGQDLIKKFEAHKNQRMREYAAKKFSNSS